MKKGWKSYLGAIVKGIAGTAGTILIGTLPNLPVDSTTAKGAVLSGIFYFLGNALKEVGMAHKAERQVQATEGASENP